jgi:TolB-like protein/Flp pilus assembly protein TadD
VKILDFGLAQIREPVHDEADTATLTPAGTAYGTVMGTVGYMSPEQVRGRPSDGRSDIFALGCVLHEMLTGKIAFARESTADTQAAILKEDPPPLTSTGVTIPAELERTVNRCLEKSPEARFQSASDLAFALRSITTNHVVPSTATDRRAKGLWMASAALLIIIAALVGAFGPWFYDRQQTDSEQIRSIALLPLDNLTGDPEQDYLVDGIHEELILTFSQVSAFDKVIGRTSVMEFRDTNTPIREIGARLGVESVLEGSVRQADDVIRVTVQLVDTRTESHVWADSFERDITNILKLQSDIARAVVEQVQLAVSPDDDRRLAESRTVDAEAYRMYLRGVRLSRLLAATEENLYQAQTMFQGAVERDPGYSESYAGLSRVFHQLAHLYHGPVEYMPRAHAAAIKAVELDPDSQDALVALGATKLFWEWDWVGARSTLGKAVKLNPGNWSAALYYADYLVLVGQPESAIEVMRRASELDPLNVMVHRGLGFILGLARRFDEGIAHLEDTVRIYPNDAMARWDLAVNYMGAKRYEAAAHEIDQMMVLFPAFRSVPIMMATKIWTHEAAGRHGEVEETMGRLLALSEQRYVAPSSMGWAYIILGDTERGIDFFEKAYEIRDTQLVAFALAPDEIGLKTHPRIQNILRHMDYPGFEE